LLTDKQTNRKEDKRRVKHNLFGGGNEQLRSLSINKTSVNHNLH